MSIAQTACGGSPRSPRLFTHTQVLSDSRARAPHSRRAHASDAMCLQTIPFESIVKEKKPTMCAPHTHTNTSTQIVGSPSSAPAGHCVFIPSFLLTQSPPLSDVCVLQMQSIKRHKQLGVYLNTSEIAWYHSPTTADRPGGGGRCGVDRASASCSTHSHCLFNGQHRVHACVYVVGCLKFISSIYFGVSACLRACLLCCFADDQQIITIISNIYTYISYLRPPHAAGCRAAAVGCIILFAYCRSACC